MATTAVKATHFTNKRLTMVQKEKLQASGRLSSTGQDMTENQRAGPVALLRTQWHFCLRQYFLIKKHFLFYTCFDKKK